MSAPNFFILGAPKSGTTALSEYLRSHPRIFMCSPKEPHYFADDLPGYRYVQRRQDYLDLYAGATSAQVAVGEASVYYLYSATAVPNILRESPDAKFIVMLRNPVDLAVSLHAQARYSRVEPIRSFAEAWAACGTRRRGIGVPRHCQDPKILLYDQVAQTGGQLQRLLSRVPRDRVRWWFLEDLQKDARALYREVLEFLGVDDDWRESFPRINERKTHRIPWIGQLTQQPPRRLVRPAMRLKQSLGLERLGVLDFLRRVNTRALRAAQLPRALEQEMAAFFAPDVRLLASVTGRNLDHWQQRTVLEPRLGSDAMGLPLAREV